MQPTRRELSGRFRPAVARFELGIWAALLLAVNVSPLRRAACTVLAFQWEAVVAKGQWWRVATYPLVHLSWYHLLLDGGAFLLLYGGLVEPRGRIRGAILAACSGGSLLCGHGCILRMGRHGKAACQSGECQRSQNPHARAPCLQRCFV